MYFTEKDIGKIITIVSELSHNIRHSEDEGYISMQKYVNKQRNKRYLMIGVGDLGIGIKDSLGKIYDVSEWSDIKAISQSIQKGCSCLSARGMGLYLVPKIMKDYNSELYIKSGNGRVCLTHKNRSDNTEYFPGTQISVTISNS